MLIIELPCEHQQGNTTMTNAEITKIQAIAEAKKSHGGYIQERGGGTYANWVFLGRSYPGHSLDVYAVSAQGDVRRCA
jgi:hypothetical protein